MTSGDALVATLVVASKTRHELLRVWTGWNSYLREEIRGFSAAQCGGDAPVMKDFDVAVLSAAEAEAEVSGIFGRA